MRHYLSPFNPIQSLALLLVCLTPKVSGQPAEACLNQFAAKAAAFTSTVGWRQCGPLPPGAFARIRTVLEQNASNAVMEVGISDALIVFFRTGELPHRSGAVCSDGCSRGTGFRHI